MSEFERELATLGQDIYALPSTKVLRLSQLLETAASVPDTAVVANHARRLFRPRLKQVRPPRRVTALRLFCLPFEDILDEGVPDGKLPGCIARSTILPIWKHFLGQGGEDALRDVQKSLDEAGGLDMAKLDEDLAVHIAGRLWKSGSEFLQREHQRSLDRKDLRRQLTQRLGGAHVLAEMLAIGQMLAIADSAMRMKPLFSPAPVEDLTIKHTDFITAELRFINQSGRGRPADLFLLAAARLRNPFDILKMTRELNASAKVEESSAADYVRGALGENLISMAFQLSTDLEKEPDIERVLTRGEAFSERLAAFHGAKAGPQGASARIESSVDEARHVLHRVIEQKIVTGAQTEIVACLPFSPSTDPEVTMATLTDPAAIERQAKAEARARSLARALQMATAPDLRAAITRTIDDVVNQVENLSADAAQRAQGDPAARAQAQVTIGLAMRVVEGAIGPAEAFDRFLRHLGG